jgi:phage tail-like protein
VAVEHPLFGTSSFRVLIGDRELAFAEVTPLTSATEMDSPRTSRHHHFEPVVLRRALTRSTELYDWRRKIVEGAEDRRTVTIEQLERPDGPVVNSWRLVDAWPSRWSGPAFNALGTEVAIEELELVFTDLVWLKPTRKGG